jgi:hypothetical protein
MERTAVPTPKLRSRSAGAALSLALPWLLVAALHGPSGAAGSSRPSASSGGVRPDALTDVARAATRPLPPRPARRHRQLAHLNRAPVTRLRRIRPQSPGGSFHSLVAIVSPRDRRPSRRDLLALSRIRAVAGGAAASRGARGPPARPGLQLPFPSASSPIDRPHADRVDPCQARSGFVVPRHDGMTFGFHDSPILPAWSERS